MQRSRLLWAVIGYLFLRWILAIQPGYVIDVQSYKRWALFAARFGLAQVYETSDMDYPPLYVYLLYPLGRLYGWISPEALETHGDTGILTLLIKLPPLLFDLGIAALLYYTAIRVAGSWGRFDGRRWGALAAVLYLLNPAVLFDTAYWGQPDSIHSFFVLAAFLSVFGRRFWVPWALLALGLMMKPLAAPYFPLLLVLSWARFGTLRTLGGGATAGLVTLLVLSPFILAGETTQTLTRISGDVVLMANTTSNAHNLWWVLRPWQDANAPWFGPLSTTQLSMVLFALFYLGLLWKAHHLHHRQPGGIREPQAIGLAFLVGFGFFMIATHMHENHLFAAVPLALPLALAAGRPGRSGLWIYAAISLAVLLNTVLHDPILTLAPPFSWGGPSGHENPHLGRPFLVAELWGIRFSAFFSVALFFGLLANGLRRGGWLDRMGEAVPDHIPSSKS